MTHRKIKDNEKDIEKQEKQRDNENQELQDEQRVAH